jgi:hypothetical protein
MRYAESGAMKNIDASLVEVKKPRTHGDIVIAVRIYITCGIPLESP